MSTGTPGKSKRMRKFGVAALTILVTLLLGEIGLRLYRWIKNDPYSSAGATRRLDELMSELRGLQFVPEAAKSTPGGFGVVLHPYQGYQIELNTLAAGKELPYFESAEGQANFDILLIGGSVAAQFGNFTDTYLVPELKKDPRLSGRTIRIHNFGCPGHKQPQHVMGLQWLLTAGCKPDAVLLIDGYNDIAIALENSNFGVHPGYPSWAEMQMRLGTAMTDSVAFDLKARIVFAQAEAEAVNARLRRWPLTMSAITGTYAVHALGTAVERMRHWRRELRKHEAEELAKGYSLAVTGAPYDKAPEKVVERALGAWRESSRSMQAICRVRGIPFLHVLQPAACDAGSKPLTPEEAAAAGMATPWGVSIKANYPRLREVGKELQGEGVNFLDASFAFAGHAERIYEDGCHFAGEGSAILSRLIAEAFLRTWRQ